MKNFLSLFIMVFSITMSVAQNNPKPEFIDVPYFWNKESNELTILSKETADIKPGLKVKYTFLGTESKTKINTSKVSLIVNSTNAMMLTAMKIYKLTVMKKSREVEFASVGFGKVDIKDDNVIDFNSKNIEGNTYELVLSSELEKGEYVITNGMISYTFSVN